jgi:mono/diheme cytochrome c family protein
MSKSTNGLVGTLSLVATLAIGSLVIHGSVLANADALAGGSLVVPAAQKPGQAHRGRAIFNGKGICYYCHGVDGRPDQLPQLEPDTASVVARLSPVPVDLRNPSLLKLRSDKERFHAIREGHPGTGMLPETKLTDREINDIVAYLALLRREGAQNLGKAPVPHPKEQP